MANRRDDEWKEDYQTYSETQVEAILSECGIDIDGETGSQFICYCPFHSNNDSPAFAVDKEKGLFFCFNPSCGQSGKLEDIPRRLLKLNVFQTKRLILKHQDAKPKPLSVRRMEREARQKLPEFSQDVIDKMHNDFWESPAEDYMVNRGFEIDTLKTFQVGYSKAKNLVAVPMYAERDKPVGVVGRTLPPQEKGFRNSNNLPKKQIPFNIHNARTHGDTVIICEASFDAMRITQAGYPNVIALLGGYLTPWHHEIIDRTFSKIIVMTDFDPLHYNVDCKPCKRAGYRICNGHNAGRDFGRQIVSQFPHKVVKWAAYDDTCVYPHNAKDASDMTDDEIRKCLRDAISNYQYQAWKIEPQLLR